jgi:hypothetical protein
MAEPYLATPEDLATLTKLPADSQLLLVALSRASDRFRQDVGHPVHKVEDDLVVLDGDGSDFLFLPAAPFTDIAVVVDGVAVSDYEANLRTGVLRRRTRWPAGWGNISVVYSHGYDPIPGGIQDAVLEQAAILATVQAGVASETAGPQQVSYGQQATVGITQRWADAVAAYRLGRGDRS